MNFVVKDCEAVPKAIKKKPLNIGDDILYIKEHNFDEFNTNSSTLILGKSTEKELYRHLIVDIFNNIKGIDKYIICCSRDETNKFYEKYVNKECICYDFSEEMMKNIVNHQISTNKKEKILLVLDECVLSQKILSGDLFLNPLHYYNITFVCKMQPQEPFNHEAIISFDNIFIFEEDDDIIRNEYFELYFGTVSKKESFEKIFDLCTEDDCCICLYNNRIVFDDQIKWYKPNQNNKFTFHLCVSNNILFNEEDTSISSNASDTSSVDLDINYISSYVCDDDIKMNILLNIAKCNHNISNILSNNSVKNKKAIEICDIVSKCNNVVTELNILKL